MSIYADNAATTPLTHHVLSVYTDTLKNIFGNASSVHGTGFAASCALEGARESLARLLGCASENIIFTSGGSESNNLALLSAAHFGELSGKRHIVSSAIEHPSVLEVLKLLSRRGFEITYVRPDESGIVAADDIDAAIRPDTALAVLMHANNEIGTLQPIRETAELCRRRNVQFHCDAVQSAGHIRLNAAELGVDTLSLSAHKFHGPKGIGALLVRDASLIKPLIRGGEQERGLRAGTENVPAICAMAAALEESLCGVEEKQKAILSMRERLIDGILTLDGSHLNGDRQSRIAGNANFSFDGIGGEQLVLLLDSYGIELSSGSACAARSSAASHVLLAMGAASDRAGSTLRISLDEYNTQSEVDEIISAVKRAVAAIRSIW